MLVSGPAARDLWRLASERLTDAQWQAFVLVYGQELSYQAAADVLRVDEATVRGRVRRALARMRQPA